MLFSWHLDYNHQHRLYLQSDKQLVFPRILKDDQQYRIFLEKKKKHRNKMIRRKSKILPRKSSCQFLAVDRSLSVKSAKSSYSLENNDGSNCILDNARVASRPANNEYDPPKFPTENL